MPTKPADKGVRFSDRGGLRKPEKQPNGWLVVDGYIGRCGIMEYSRADGTTFKQYRPPEEAFNKDSLESFAMVPLTKDHPPGFLLDADNTKMFQVGTVERPFEDGDKVRSRMLVTDADTIAWAEKVSAESGGVEVSSGYLADVEWEPGEVNGEHYDAVQRNIRGNHVALVRAGRAGPEVRIRMDATENLVFTATYPDSKRIDQGKPMNKVHIDGVDYEVPESAAQAFAKLEAKRETEISLLKGTVETQTARADAAESTAKKLGEDLAAAPEKIRAAIAARFALESSAKQVLGEVTFDGKSDIEVKRTVAQNVTGLNLDGKSDAYVEASFELALKAHADAEVGALASARAGTKAINTDGATDPAEAARLKFEQHSRNAHARK